MSEQSERWQDRYKQGETPWDIGRVDSNLVLAVEEGRVNPCKTLDIGCGTGTNALWLQSVGFNVTGIDISPLAIDKALEKQQQFGGNCDFYCGDFLENNVEGYPFDFIFDRGCFHIFDEPEVREFFVKRVSEHLSKDGLWLSFIGSTDGPPRTVGPPRRSAMEITRAVEPFFEILSMNRTIMDSDRSIPPWIWICLMKKRTLY